MDIRPFISADHSACLALFDSNVPDFFGAKDRVEFVRHLEAPAGEYLVAEHEGSVLGCGGYYVTEDPSVARLAWGMVHRDWHRRGLGRFLLMYRLREISKAAGVRMVEVATSQLTAPFFEHQGFKTLRIAENGYGPGIHRVEMAMKLAVCP